MPRKRNNKNQVQVTECVRLAVDCTIKKFLNMDEANEWEYPSCFSSAERAYIHKEACRYGLKSKSRGTGDTRYITIYKREGSAIVQKDAALSLTSTARSLLLSLLNKQPVSAREQQDCMPPHDRSKDTFNENREGFRGMGRLMANVPQPPRSSPNKAYSQVRTSLPIYNMRDTIIKTIGDNQVTIISGATGSGKSTQVPQYLLEWHESVNRPCRIVVTQPRRISAVSVSERIALERGEKLGHTVGYQIRLEGKVSPYTVVTLCTVGVLVRTLMSSEQVLSSVSHVIIDEVHERDRQTDFLLLVLREALSKHRSLRLVLMSATANTHQLSSYFNNCPVISVAKNSFEVKEFFLEDVLKMTSYLVGDMDRMKKNYYKRKSQAALLEKWKNVLNSDDKSESQISPNGNFSNLNYTGVNKEMDEALHEAWMRTNSNHSEKILNLVSNEVNIDYQHSETGLTALMIAAALGYSDLCEQLLQSGASLTVRAPNNCTALDFANEFKQVSTSNLIKQHMFLEEHMEGLNHSDEGSELVEMYYSCYGYNNIDTRLIVNLITNIHCDYANKGSILVFLPGYDDIMSTREALLQDEKKLNCKGSKVIILMLHSRMQTSDQRLIFKAAPPGCRKVILSTNIAETSVTIDDVVYVIDCGKVKDKLYNALTGASQLSTVWISKSCSEQRKGRAGRTQPGICYRLYSANRYKIFAQHKVPEILHTPIPDLCLYAKLLAPPNTSIVDFLSKALDPPSSTVTRSAVSFLKTIDALDTWEDLTDLGHHLLELPVDPKYGKMLIYASLLKCMDPVLTIVCCLSYRELFILPPVREKKKIANEERIKFSSGSLSDHMTLLRVFQGWQEAKRQGRERQFCREHFISGPMMELILGTRVQVLAQLRASGFIRAKGPGDIKSVNINSDNWAVVKAAIVGGLYPNIARLDRDHFVLRTQKAATVGVESESVLYESSALQNLPTDWVVYEEMIRAGRSSKIRTATVVSPVTIAIFAGPSKIPFDAFSDVQVDDSSESDSGEEELTVDKTAQFKLDDWITFKMDSESAILVMQLRIKWHALLLKKLKACHKLLGPVDDTLITTIVRVLSSEEQAVRLKQPNGVGRRPYLVNTDQSRPIGTGTNSPW